jgi:hypothetical protein
VVRVVLRRVNREPARARASRWGLGDKGTAASPTAAIKRGGPGTGIDAQAVMESAHVRPHAGGTVP